jgi:hypothetical protein
VDWFPSQKTRQILLRWPIRVREETREAIVSELDGPDDLVWVQSTPVLETTSDAILATEEDE